MADSTDTTTVSNVGRIDRLAENKYAQLLVTAGPVVVFEAIFFLGALTIMLLIATWEMQDFTLIRQFNINNFTDALTKLQNIQAFKTTILVASLSTITTAIFAFPVAYYIAMYGGEYKNQLVALIIVPFWTNYVVRIFGWRSILSTDGILNKLLLSTGIVDEPLGFLLNSRFAIYFGLVYLWLPFMILPLYSSLEGIDRSLIEAAKDLGASKFQAFRYVVFPLSIPGLLAGTIFVFIFSMGSFIVPSLLGGGTPFIGTRIEYEFGFGADWPAGSALGTILMIIVLVTLGTLIRHANMEDIF
ncbi:putrescine/spermidine ABC transporter permease [Halobacteriales archaeon QH_7_66_37]|jgi:ABC-type spermidine/putrescine transport system permease subunit I|nr:MAG: putrescine/spermidine ABC transporter permease [Halobacteriales archaeon QH_7_66_37]